MYQAIKKLNVLGSVLYLAAHPDDENGRLITYLSKDCLYRTGYLSLTRGDGGQNLIGDEQGIELGLIRTQELLAARRIDGGEQFFTRAYDFGFSKNPEETFTKWDREKILADVVYVIRQFKPDVIITRFPTTGEGGHGHHTASAILANEAFSLAANPAKFPEQLKYVTVWQPKRVLWNTFNFGGTNTTSNDQLKLDVGGYNPLLGKSYGEIAAESRSQHKSQGFGATATRGESLEYFKTTQGDAPVSDIMDGIDLSWKKIPGGEKISKMVDEIAAKFDFLHPEKSVKDLVQLYSALASMPKDYWTSRKLQEVKNLIQQCSGLFMDATSPEQFVVVNDSIRVNFSYNNRLGANASLKKVTLAGPSMIDSTFNTLLAKNRNFNYSKTFYIPYGAVVTQPYWLKNKMEEGYFNVTDLSYIGQPDVEPTFYVITTVNIEGTDMEFTRPVKYKFTDPVKGELYEPLVVREPLDISPSQELIITRDNNSFESDLTLISRKKNLSVSFKDLAVKNKDEKLQDSFTPAALNFTSANQAIPARFKVQASMDNEYGFILENKDAKSKESLLFPKEFHQVKYNHIPFISYYSDAVVKNVKIDVKTYNKKIGYIVGAGDKVPEALEQMGYEVTLLTDKELSRNGLEKFDAIITGVRAYNTNDWMNKHYDRLMKYVNDGGNLIVQYNTSNQIGPVRAKIGPYPLEITRTRITDENAKVTILKPDHPAFNFPNIITDEDFKGWIQERSIYHAADTTTKYEKLLRMNDPGERPDEGSLVVGRYGKGWFTYTGLVFFRELPAGVPGAYRLLANLIALNRKKAF
jgi:LmbE family N-acetylglucosaminyl deacetylase